MSSVLTTNTRAFCVTQAQVYPDTLDLMQKILALPYSRAKRLSAD